MKSSGETVFFLQHTQYFLDSNLSVWSRSFKNWSMAIILDKTQIHRLIQTKYKFTGKYALSSMPDQTLWRGCDNLSFGFASDAIVVYF